MNTTEKIILTTVLTWLIFGLFNLYGQPQFFLPPLPYNGYILAVVAVLMFIQHKPHEFNNIGYYFFMTYILICIIASFYEAFEVNLFFFLLILLLLLEAVLFPVVLFKQKNNTLYFLGYLLFYLFTIITFILLIIPFPESDTGVYLYFFTGFTAFICNILFRNKGDLYMQKTLWLYFLGVFFEAGEYIIVNYLS